MHLTNYSINKKAENYVRNENKDSDQEDNVMEKEDISKWSYTQLKNKLSSLGHDCDKVDTEIKDVIIKSIISVEPYVSHQMNMHTKHKNVCFELYGFDIILDSKLKPWLLEVNVGPSLSSSSPFDKRLKTKLICDTLTLIGVKPYDKSSDKGRTSLYNKIPKLKQKSESEKISASYGKLYSNSPKKMMKAPSNVNATAVNDMTRAEDYEVLSEFIEQEDR